MYADDDGDLDPDLVARPEVLAAYRRMYAQVVRWEVPGDVAFLAGWNAARGA